MYMSIHKYLSLASPFRRSLSTRCVVAMIAGTRIRNRFELYGLLSYGLSFLVEQRLIRDYGFQYPFVSRVICTLHKIGEYNFGNHPTILGR